MSATNRTIVNYTEKLRKVIKEENETYEIDCGSQYHVPESDTCLFGETSQLSSLDGKTFNYTAELRSVIKEEEEVDDDEVICLGVVKTEPPWDHNLHDMNKLTVPECIENKELKTENELKNNVHYDDDKQFTCKLCGKMFSNKFNLQHHQVVHGAFCRVSECEICRKPYYLISSVNKQINANSGKNGLKCETCQKALSVSSDLKKHYVVPYYQKPISESSDLKTFSVAHTDQKAISESLYSKKHSVVPTYQEPISEISDLKIHSVVSTNQKAISESSDLNIHSVVSTNQKAISESSALKIHSVVSTAKTAFNCDMCHEEFTENAHLKKHKSVHSGVDLKPLQCEVCHKRFYHLSRLRVHFVKHTRESPFKCDLCNKGFTQKCNLTRHLVVHTGEKPFHCKICHKGFSQKTSLKIHFAVHTGEKLFQCRICKLKFASKCKLMNHQLVHKGVIAATCEICQQLFYRSSSLKVHLAKHTRVKRCHICLREFSNGSNLKRHLALHSKGEKLKCDTFNRECRQKGGLDVHLKEKRLKSDMYRKEFLDTSSVKSQVALHPGNTPTNLGLYHTGFSAPLNPINYNLIHAGVQKTVECRICRRGFFDRGSLKRHFINSHVIVIP